VLAPPDGKDIARFDFRPVRYCELLDAAINNKVVVRDTVVHNVTRETFRERALRALAGLNVTRLVEEPTDLIPNGPVSSNPILLNWNALEVDDPKIGFHSHFLVLDRGRLWQWKVADFVRVPGRSYGRYESNEVDLSQLNVLHDEWVRLRNARVKSGDVGYADYRSMVVDLYARISDVRRTVLEALWKLHIRKRNALQLHRGTTALTPPSLSNYETYKVVTKGFMTQLCAGGLFFNLSVQNAKRAAGAGVKLRHQPSPSNLDRVFERRASSIVFAAACLETLANEVGPQHLREWGKLEYIPTFDKWNRLVNRGAARSSLNDKKDPGLTLKLIFDLRNKLVHHKPKFRSMGSRTGTIRTYTEELLPETNGDTLLFV